MKSEIINQDVFLVNGTDIPQLCKEAWEENVKDFELILQERRLIII